MVEVLAEVVEVYLTPAGAGDGEGKGPGARRNPEKSLAEARLWLCPSASEARRLRLLDLDLDVDPGRQIEALQRIDRLGRWLEDVEQALVDAHLEVLP